MSADHPKDDGGFLARWSRRKQDAAQPAADPPAHAPAPAVETATPAEEPEVPLAELPPLDSIGPDFDIRPWLRRRLPLVWRQAALRRVWATDPMIRDFKGLADYDWDFHTPGALPGFGPLKAGADLPRLLDQALGRRPPARGEQEPPGPDTSAAEAPATAAAAPRPDSPDDSGEGLTNTVDIDNQSQNDFRAPSRDRDGPPGNFATLGQNLPTIAVNDPPSEDEPPPRRRGGGATPR